MTLQQSQITEGDPVWVEKLSYGFMTADRFADGSDLWMLATGTGLGPFVSLLQERSAWERFRNLILVHCVRHADELTYQDKFAALQEQAASLGLPATLHLVRPSNPAARTGRARSGSRASAWSGMSAAYRSSAALKSPLLLSPCH